ncbi:MAG TPA: DUF1800 domain-containing protein [Rhodospirillaceae bacterium]|nr:DUF1800 domain-containing protein [Rhodospirillaceae bacterium]
MVHRGLCISLVVLLLSCGSAAADDAALSVHLLNRLAYGPNDADTEAIRRLGVDAWIERQLHPDSIDLPAFLTDRLDRLETTRLDAETLFERYKPSPQDQQARRQSRIVVREAAEARLLRAIYSPRQLQEVMVDFWFNHFNVFAGKGLDRLWIGNYEEVAIRPHVLGRFRDLLEATARHPAMLFYLDNWQNAAPGSPGDKGKDSGLNENYARELMELHTLGVDGGYHQEDVVALARILTGWGIARPGRAGAVNGFAFHPRRHDFGDKVFLGRTIPGSGAGEVEQALDILAGSPATARHISFQLAQYFIGDQPPAAVVDRLSRRWMETDGDIRAVLKTLFASRQFRDPGGFGGKFKTPWQFVISAARASGVEVVNIRPLLGTLKRLGQPLYECLTPDGYKDSREAWLNADGLTTRINFSTALGSGHLPLDRRMPDEEDDESSRPADPPRERPVPIDSDRLAWLLGPALSARTRELAEQAAKPLKAGLIIGSPDFMAR